MLRYYLCTLLLALALLSVAACDSTTEPEFDDFDWTGLLNDEELRTEADPNAPDENRAWANWIRGDNIAIRSLEAANFSDLRSLVPYLSDKRIVQLGESGHGVAEFNQVKVRLIKFLHEEMGFNVIAFESGLFDCYYANDNVSSFTPVDMMTNSIFGVWHTWEVVPLFEYLKQVSNESSPLTLAGFDIQVSSPKAGSHRPEFLSQLVAMVDTDFAEHVYEVDTEYVSRHREEDYILENKDVLIAEYEIVVNFIDENREELMAKSSGNPAAVGVARQIAWSVTKEIEYLFTYYTGWPGAAFEVRDRSMAENVDFLISELYPEEKIIIWAHNAHVCHDRRARPEMYGNSMGKWIVESHRPELYTIGLYMYRGEAAWNNREVYQVTPVISGSVESVFYRTRRKYCFVNMLGRVRNEGNSWMFENITAKLWGTADWLLIPKNQYDAILFIDTASPPSYIESSTLDEGLIAPLEAAW